MFGNLVLPSEMRFLAPLTSFVGRKQEIVTIKEHLSTTRLLTLTGVGGCGKTRLALQVATELLKEFNQQVWWVELEELDDPALLSQTIAQALGVPEQPGRPLMEALVHTLWQKKLLLVLNTCEHLATACAQFVRELLHMLPEIRLLVTSREVLDLAGEMVWTVPPLSYPGPQYSPFLKHVLQYEAVQLFTERARSAVPSFVLTQENLSTVVRVCQRLDGLPLAIELVAERMKMLSLSQIGARLDDACPFLTTTSCMLTPRHQTLQATFDWSYDLLSPLERRLFCRLSVFTGTFTLEAAAAICTGEDLEKGSLLDLLTRLVNKSLVKVMHRNGEVWYQLSEIIQQYAQKKLLMKEGPTIWRERHLNWYLDFAARVKREIPGAQQTLWLERLEMEDANLRAALSWAIERGKKEDVARIGATIWRLWLFQGQYVSDATHWLEQMIGDTIADLTVPSAPVPSFQPFHSSLPEPSLVKKQAPELSIYALGRAQVALNGRIIAPGDWRYTKAKDMLFYLLSYGPRTKEQIGLALWPEASPSQLRSSFHTSLHHLRLVLGRPEWILFENGMYLFNRHLSYWFDVESFEHAVAQAKKAPQIPQVIRFLEGAIRLYQGDFLETVLDGEWHLARQRELQQVYLEVFLKLGQLYFAEERYRQAAGVYQRLISYDRFIEVAHRELMRCYAKQGERSLALRHYQLLMKMTYDEFGSPPSPETTLLFERLQKGEAI